MFETVNVNIGNMISDIIIIIDQQNYYSYTLSHISYISNRD